MKKYMHLRRRQWVTTSSEGSEDFRKGGNTDKYTYYLLF